MSSVSIPCECDTIVVLSNVSTNVHNVNNELFSSSSRNFLSLSQDLSVLGSGTIYYCSTRNYDAVMHAVQFLEGYRVQHTFSTDSCDDQPTLCAFNPEGFHLSYSADIDEECTPEHTNSDAIQTSESTNQILSSMQK